MAKVSLPENSAMGRVENVEAGLHGHRKHVRKSSDGVGRRDSMLQRSLAEKEKIAQQANDKLRAAERQIKSAPLALKYAYLKL